MKTEEAVQYMSKLYLERTIKSFTSDYPSRKDEEEYREIIKRNIEIISDHDSINNRIENYIKSNYSNPYEKKPLMTSKKLEYYFIATALMILKTQNY